MTRRGRAALRRGNTGEVVGAARPGGFGRALFVLAVAVVVGCDEAEPPARTIPYDVVDEWTLPDGGAGRSILIHSSLRNVTDLRALGDQLRWDHRNERNVQVEVFDDRRAAGLRRQEATGNLADDDRAHHDRHKVAFYRKVARGDHELVIALGGVGGHDWITVAY
jgi:hypothetical protein